jgi:16S rRNA (uracil1498-N3)-methyltransferase
VLAPGASHSLGAFARAASSNDVWQLLIGPEGGLSDGELRDAASRGFVAVSLGPRVLRTETAPLAALALLQGLLGDLG